MHAGSYCYIKKGTFLIMHHAWISIRNVFIKYGLLVTCKPITSLTRIALLHSECPLVSFFSCEGRQLYTCTVSDLVKTLVGY